jgi:hypothetical protein
MVTSSPEDDSAQEANPTAAVTGNDPSTRPECMNDAQVAASSQEPQFLIKIVYSPTCKGVWGKVERNDNLGMGNTITYRRSDPDSLATQQAVEPDAQSAFTNLIVRQDPTDRVCVNGSITLGEQKIEAQQPICI